MKKKNIKQQSQRMEKKKQYNLVIKDMTSIKIKQNPMIKINMVINKEDKTLKIDLIN